MQIKNIDDGVMKLPLFIEITDLHRIDLQRKRRLVRDNITYLGNNKQISHTESQMNANGKLEINQ